MSVAFEAMMRELSAPKERAAILRTAARIAKRHMALRELRKAGYRTQAVLRRVGHAASKQGRTL